MHDPSSTEVLAELEIAQLQVSEVLAALDSIPAPSSRYLRAEISKTSAGNRSPLDVTYS